MALFSDRFYARDVSSAEDILMGLVQGHARMQKIYDRLITGDGDFTTEDYDAIVEYFGAEEIPYDVLKGRTGTVDEWFLANWDNLDNRMAIEPSLIDREVSVESGLCPDCKGSGEYAGILVVEKCQRCKGLGLI